MVEQAKLIASDASSDDMFSFDAVAISGNYAIVGAAYDDTMQVETALHIFLFEMDRLGVSMLN